MDIQITPRPLRGEVTPPPSKSLSHRLLLAASLTDGESELQGLSLSQDVVATMRCLEALGARFARDGDSLLVRGVFHGGARPAFPETPRFDCGESGSTLRFLIPVALALAGGGVFTGRGRLMERPMQPYEALFAEKGVSFVRRDGAIEVRGSLSPGEYRMPGNVSSQFFTGLLFALPMLDGTSRVASTTKLESSGYLDMTLDALRTAGVGVAACRRPADGSESFAVFGPAEYRPFCRRAEADWSQAAFFVAARGLGSGVTLAGMNPDSCQGDAVIADWAEELAGPDDLEIDVSDTPDLVPPLAAWAALREGRVTRLTGAERLRLKESDRLEAVASELGKLGAQIGQGSGSLTIRGVGTLRGGTADSRNDHRIAMMLAVAATRADGPVTIRGAECVAKSYPDFWDVYRSLGGQLLEVTA